LSKREEVLRLMAEHAGEWSAKQIAEQAGCTDGYVRVLASEKKISLAVPGKANSLQSSYAVNVPMGREEEIAGKVNAILEHLPLPSKSAVFILALDRLAAEIGG